MLSDEDMIIKIPADDSRSDEVIKDAEFTIVDPDEDTPVDDVQEEAPQESSEPVSSWPALKMYHPMLGVEGTLEEIPEDHEFWLAANIMMAPAGTPLREGQNSIFISGKTPEDVAAYVHKVVLTVFQQMIQKNSVIQPANMGQVPPTPRGQ